MKRFILVLVSPFLIGAPAIAQINYEWHSTSGDAHWGEADINDAQMTTYHDLTSSGSLKEYDLDYGPSAEKAGVLAAGSASGVVSSYDPAVFDLSAVGSSALIYTAVVPVTKWDDTGGAYNIFEFGLSAGDDVFGYADSLFIAGDVTTYTVGHGPAGIGSYDLKLFNDEGSDQDATDGVWDMNPMATLATGLVFDPVVNYGLTNDREFEEGIVPLLELRYENLGGGQMMIDWAVTEIDFNDDTGVVSGATVATSGSMTVTHGLTSLSALRPGLGYRSNDSDNPVSGGSFDYWEGVEDFRTLVIPEPSSLLMVVAAAFMLQIRRRRR